MSYLLFLSPQFSVWRCQFRLSGQNSSWKSSWVLLLSEVPIQQFLGDVQKDVFLTDNVASFCQPEKKQKNGAFTQVCWIGKCWQTWRQLQEYIDGSNYCYSNCAYIKVIQGQAWNNYGEVMPASRKHLFWAFVFFCWEKMWVGPYGKGQLTFLGRKPVCTMVLKPLSIPQVFLTEPRVSLGNHARKKNCMEFKAKIRKACKRHGLE